MKDEEYIEMLRDQREAKEKPVYTIRFPEDFYPFVGAKNHLKRCLENIPFSSNPNVIKDFSANSSVRNFALILYNYALFCGAAYGISQLVEYFSK